jgi:hypothetical protein
VSETDTGSHEVADPAGGSGQTGASEIVLDDPIIDLTDPEGTWDRVENDLNPFERLDKPNRMRLMIRVLCELVAEGELDADGNPIEEAKTAAASPRPATGGAGTH